MGSLDDPKLADYHDQITKAFYWSSPPKYQTICEVLNGMAMDDMLDEFSRIKTMGKLDDLVRFIPTATGVNNDRLRAAAGALQDQPPQDLDTLVLKLPADQQRAIKSVRAVTQAPPSLNPWIWPKYYWQLRILPKYVPPPTPSNTAADSKTPDDDASKGKGDDDDEAHLAADIAAALTANAPKGSSPMTYSVTVIYRNLDAFKLGEGDNELALVHEPNITVQISPDPNNNAAVTAVVTLINLHMKRHWGLIKPDVELSISGQGGVQGPAGTPTGGFQGQVEVHVTTSISVTVGTSIGFGPPIKPGDPPDRGAFHFGNRDVDMAFTPFSIGILGHWDPPSK
jgi:hypothetical protein